MLSLAIASPLKVVPPEAPYIELATIGNPSKGLGIEGNEDFLKIVDCTPRNALTNPQDSLDVGSLQFEETSFPFSKFKLRE